MQLNDANIKTLIKNFKITNDMKRTAKTVFLCMAYRDTIKPIVEEYQRKVLKFWKFPCASTWRGRAFVEGAILDPKDSYLLSEEDFKLYHADLQDEQKAAGLKVDHPDHCPLLIAESNLVDAEKLLLRVMEPFTGVKLDDVLGNMDVYHKYVDLSLRLLAPHVKTATEGGL